MKRGLIKIGMMTVLISMMSFSVYGQEVIPTKETTLNEYSTEQLQLRNTDTKWRYKFINGVRHKRLYNIYTDEWIGEWIKA